MKKYFIFALIALLALTSCNLDSEHGLYDSIQKAEEIDENPISNFVGFYQDGEKVHYVFNTQRGVALDGSTSIIMSGNHLTKMVDTKGNMLTLRSNSEKTEWVLLTSDGKTVPYTALDKYEVKSTCYWYGHTYNAIATKGDEWFLISITDKKAFDLTAEDAFTFTNITELVKGADGKENNRPQVIGPDALRFVKDKAQSIYVLDGTLKEIKVSGDKAVERVINDEYYVQDSKLFRIGGREVATPDGKSFGIPGGEFFFDIADDMIMGVSLDGTKKIRLFGATLTVEPAPQELKKSSIYGVRIYGNKLNVITKDKLGMTI